MAAAVGRVDTIEPGRVKLENPTEWVVAYSGRAWPNTGDNTPQARRRRATELAFERVGISKAARALISPSSVLHDTVTPGFLRSRIH